MHNPNPIPDVGSRWLKFQPRRGTPIEVEVLARDARHTSGDRLITYREVATEYVRTIRFTSWRQPSMVAPVPSASEAPDASAPALAAPTVGTPRVDAATGAPPCKVCGKPCKRRGGKTGNVYRTTCSDACLAIRKNEVARMATLASASAAARRDRQATEPMPVTTPTPRPHGATGLRAAERGGWLTVYLPADIRSAFQARCIADACCTQDAVSTALLAWLTSPTA